MRSEVLHEMIRQLRAELKLLDQVIRRVEAVGDGRGRRGRPPKGLAAARAGFEAELRESGSCARR